jgi:hypothetical protein
MTRVKALISLCCLALFGAFAGASAAPLPGASQMQAGSLAQQVDYRRCFWQDGRRVCRIYEEDDDDDDYDYPDYDYDYGGGPGIVLGFGAGGGFGHGHGGFHAGHGGHGGHH